MRVKARQAAGRLRCGPESPVSPLMVALHLVPVLLAAGVLAAHFYRAGQTLGVVAALALGALALVPRPWAARAVQAGLALGAIEWLRTIAVFAAQRIAQGQPYTRMVLILAGVALATGLAALVFERAAMRRRYGLAQPAR